MDHYADEVAGGGYGKIPYNAWRTLYRFDEVSEWVRVGLNDDEMITIQIPGFTYECASNKDFGAYLMKAFGWNKISGYLLNDGTIEYNTIDKNNKENNTMNFNFDFGPVNPSLVRMSMYGLAVKNKSGTWVSYNSNGDEIVDVDVLNFDGAKFLYRMPVAIKDIAVGDVVVHNGAPMFVVFVPQDGKTLTVVDTVNGERKDIMLPRSPFGFNFATKVVNFMGNMMASANEDNPFGNMWMLMAMSDEGEGKDMNDMLPFLMMNNATGGMDKNMMMFMALSKSEGGNKDMLLWWLMSQNMNAAPAHECKCGGNCGNHQPQN
jgi:hypothetical protein